MRLSLFHRISGLGMGALLIAGSLAASSLPRPESEAISSSPGWNFQREASALLVEMKDVTYKLNRDADTLAVLSRSNQVSWQTHVRYLNSFKNHINELGDRLERLQAIRHVAAPWQQEALDRLVPTAAELATRTEAAINHLNESQRLILAESYRGHLKAIASQAGELKETVNSFTDFGRTKEKMERLQQELEIASS